MVKIYNPKKKRYEEIDDYHYYDVTGHFPKSVLTKEDKERLKACEGKTGKAYDDCVQNVLNVPLLYHGTPKKFIKFRLDKKRNTANETSGLGVWFTDNKKVAELFKYEFEHHAFFGYDAKDVGGRVVSAFVRLRNPKVYEPYPGDESLKDKIKKLKEKKRKLGMERSINWSSSSYDSWQKQKKYLMEKEKLDEQIKELEKKSKYRDSFELMMDERDEFAEYISGAKGKRGAWQERYIALHPEETNKRFIEYLKSKGYDGIVLKDTKYDAKDAGVKKSDQVIVFNPEKILTKKDLKKLTDKK